MSPRRAILFTFAALAGILSLAAWSLTRPPAPPDFLKNRSDGYEKILAAVSELTGDPRDATNYIPEYIAANEKVFEAYNRLRNERMEAPPRFYKADTMGTDFMPLRRFANALLLKARLAENQCNYFEASQLCLETIRYGQNLGHGPLISFLLGTSTELSVIKRFEELLPALPKTNLNALINELQILNRRRPPFAEAIERERYFIANNAPNAFDAIKQQLLLMRRENHFKGTEERWFVTYAQFEILTAALAARLYTLENGKPPTALQDLVPTTIRSLPIDPFDNTPLKTVATTTNIIFYSIGPNKTDDQSKAVDISLKYSHVPSIF